jgi:hypothetical protein
MLIGFGLATGLIGARLATDPASARIRRTSAQEARRPERGEGRRGSDGATPATDVSGGGTAGIDRPFADESGRIPDASIAPFAVGLGVAVAATGLIFGPAPVIVGMLPFLWGAWTWLGSAGDELAANPVPVPRTQGPGRADRDGRTRTDEQATTADDRA